MEPAWTKRGSTSQGRQAAQGKEAEIFPRLPSIKWKEGEIIKQEKGHLTRKITKFFGIRAKTTVREDKLVWKH